MRLLVFCLFLFAAILVGNCPVGTNFVPDGTFYCGFDPAYVSPDNPSGFYCNPGGDCIAECPDCLDQSCSCFVMTPAMSAAKNPIQTITKLPNGHIRVKRRVVHTERTIDPAKWHLWIMVDPKTKQPVPIMMPFKGTLPANVADAVTRAETALHAQFPTKK